MANTQTAAETAARNASATPGLPLFYRAPLLLRFQEHAAFGIKSGADFRFAAGASAIPVVASEFAVAGRTYPIVFSLDDTAMPLLVTALEEGRNLFVTGQGAWREGCYVPGYVRRYPFIGVTDAAPGQTLLGLDGASDLVSTDAARDGAERLFDTGGGPAERARAAMALCDAYAGAYEQTKAFAAALKERNLLVSKEAAVTYADVGAATVRGFSLVDEAAFRALPQADVLEFHAKGWLDLIVLHLASQQSWQSLIDASAEARKAAA